MLKTLKKHLTFENKSIFDIIWYGSSAKGKQDARDIDLLVIFLEGTLKERLNILQDIKKKLKPLHKNIDIKQILLPELFSTAFLARTGIFIEGISVIKEKKFCETLGFQSSVLFWYNLKGLTHTQKVKFNYILAGRKDMQGLINSLNGTRLVSGAIQIPTVNALLFEEILKQHKVDYEKKEIMEKL